MQHLAILSAFILDLLIGDPKCFPYHPAKLIGNLINFLEKFLTGRFLSKRLTGILLLISVLLLTYSISSIIISVAFIIHPSLKFIFEMILIYFCLSIKDMYLHSMDIFYELEDNNTSNARLKLSMIVGRDTKNLNREEIIRATVESVSESTVDGILAPLFFAVVGGAPLALLYKSVNTLDSMVGYKNEKYFELGWASARFDDILNFIPARIAALLIPLAALICGKNWGYSLLTIINYAKKHPSPNSGFPEAAAAGALEVRLGGINYYNGIESIRPFIGHFKRPFINTDIKDINMIMLVSSILSLVLFLLFL